MLQVLNRWFTSFLKKKSTGSGIKNKIKQNQQLANELHKNFEKKIYRHMIAVSKNVYFDVLDDIVDKYNIPLHITVETKPIFVKSNSYAEYNVNSIGKSSKFKVGDHVRISKYKNIFDKGYIPKLVRRSLFNT